jgi:hypothetical protein
MTKTFATIGILWLTTGIGAAQDKAEREKALLANEMKVTEAVAKGDKATFTSMVANDAWSADNTGITKVSDFVTMFDQIKVSTWKITDPKVLLVDANNAVVIYTWTGAGTFQGQPIPSKVYAATVWTKKGEKWLVAYHQESEAAKPPPPAPARKK